MRWIAPAKINLSLRVLGKRADGFHELESLMVPISVCDALEIEERVEQGLQFECSDPSIPSDDGNLVVQAVRLFCERTAYSSGLRIYLQKEIPHGAGLGGGSSDAGTVLLALNHLSGKGLSVDELAALGAQIGSDVPFFLYQGAAWIRGRGEQVEPVGDLVSAPLLLVKPPFGVPTPWAYRHWKDSVEIPGIVYGEQDLGWATLVNDLERPVFEKYLLLADLKQWLLAQPEVSGALMSGSGATVFAVLRKKEDGPGLQARVVEEFGLGMWTALCSTLSR